MIDDSPLYLGFDLSTQQLKGIAITSDLKVAYEAVFDFDADATGFAVKKGESCVPSHFFLICCILSCKTFRRSQIVMRQVSRLQVGDRRDMLILDIVKVCLQMMLSARFSLPLQCGCRPSIQFCRDCKTKESNMGEFGQFRAQGSRYVRFRVNTSSSNANYTTLCFGSTKLLYSSEILLFDQMPYFGSETVLLLFICV